LKDGLSIIIPAYNEEKTLAASVESACAAAIASGSDFEVLIVNDFLRYIYQFRRFISLL
jgi:glycosyltransferase involved in cell wall biosynthesis